MNITRDAQTGLRRRTITTDGWTIVQVEQSNGEWWNISATRTVGP